MRLFLALVASAAVAAWWVAPAPPAAPLEHPCVKEAGPSDQDQKNCRDRYAIERAFRNWQAK